MIQENTSVATCDDNRTDKVVKAKGDMESEAERQALAERVWALFDNGRGSTRREISESLGLKYERVCEILRSRIVKVPTYLSGPEKILVSRWFLKENFKVVPSDEEIERFLDSEREKFLEMFHAGVNYADIGRAFGLSQTNTARFLDTCHITDEEMRARRCLIARTHIGVSTAPVMVGNIQSDTTSPNTNVTFIQTTDGITVPMTERQLSEQAQELQKRGRKKNPCTGCPFWKRFGSGEAYKCCHYLIVMNHRRGCHPEDCDHVLRKKEFSAMKYNPATGIYVGKKYRVSYAKI